MSSPRSRLAPTLLLIAATLAATVTLLNHAGDSGGRIASYYEEYAGGGSCKWRQGFGSPTDIFPTVLLVALLAWPAVLGAAVGFVAAWFQAAPGRERRRPSLGLAATGFVLLWLLRLDFVRAALELC